MTKTRRTTYKRIYSVLNNSKTNFFLSIYPQHEIHNILRQLVFEKCITKEESINIYRLSNASDDETKKVVDCLIKEKILNTYTLNTKIKEVSKASLYKCIEKIKV